MRLCYVRRVAVVFFLVLALSRGTSGPLQELEERLAELVAARFRPDGPGAVVLVARGAHPVLHAAYGMADVAGEVPMRTDRPLPIGSLTKSFTAGALLSLAAEGELSLSDDVRVHVPDAPVGDHAVTLEQLLTHTSGIPSLVDAPDFFEWARHERDTKALLERTRGVPFLFEPGTAFAYSDTGYILLGAVLERVGGARWDRVVRARVAEPLGLASVASAQDQGEGAPVGYEVSGASFAPAQAIDWSVPHASGALVATARDLLRWVRAWRGDAIASAELLAPAWEARDLPDGTRSGYGYGWKRCELEGRVAIQHGGWVPGFTAAVLHVPGDDLTAVCLTNADGGVEASYLARQALRLLLTGSAQLPTVELDEAELRALVGRYRTERGASWEVAARGPGLTLDLGDGPIELAALSPTRLSAADSDGTWCFTFEDFADGRARTLAMSLTCEPQGRASRVESSDRGHEDAPAADVAADDGGAGGQ